MKAAIHEYEAAKDLNFGKTTGGVKHAPLYECGMGFEDGQLVPVTLQPDDEEAAADGRGMASQLQIRHRIVLRLHRWAWNDRAKQAAFLSWLPDDGDLRTEAEIIRDAGCSESTFYRRLRELRTLVTQWAIEEMEGA